jgi:hypothetical protein
MGRRRPSLANDGVGFLLIMGRNRRGSNGRVHAPLTTSNRRVINGRADLGLHRAGVIAAGLVRSRPLRRASGLGCGVAAALLRGAGSGGALGQLGSWARAGHRSGFSRSVGSGGCAA